MTISALYLGISIEEMASRCRPQQKFVDGMLYRLTAVSTLLGKRCSDALDILMKHLPNHESSRDISRAAITSETPAATTS